MDDLFAIDRQAREQKMDHARRDVLRQQYAPPLLEPLRGEILVLQKKSLPKSAAGQAANYTLSLWTRLTLFLKYPELELPNSPCRELHATDCHRKAQLAALGEQRGWPKDAVLFSVVESCHRLGLPIHSYLGDILPGRANRSIQSLAGIKPTAYADRQAK
jgi:hypothetical protein